MPATEFRCDTCGFELWVPAAELLVSTLGLYDDARFPGRSLLVMNDHVEDFATLRRSLRDAFMDDVQRAARAIVQVTGARRVNYAILGNAEPHVHFHLVPRRIEGVPDPVPNRAPWTHPDPVHALPRSERERIIAALKDALSVPPRKQH